MVPHVLSALLPCVGLSQKNAWDYRMGLSSPYPDTRRVYRLGGWRNWYPLPFIALTGGESKGTAGCKIKSDGFFFSREEQLAEIPAHKVTCWNTLTTQRNLSQCAWGHFYFPADLFTAEEYFQGEVQQAVLIFLPKNVPWNYLLTSDKHLTLY